MKGKKLERNVKEREDAWGGIFLLYMWVREEKKILKKIVQDYFYIHDFFFLDIFF